MQEKDNHDAGKAPGNGETPSKRPYVAPKLERLGTIGELTHGLGMSGERDQLHPPGQNKSIV